jgi:polygalacturonase
MLCLAFGAARLTAAPSGLPVIPSASFNVTVYGAVGDGATDNTAAIQAALNAARASGGGTVEMPAAAEPFRCGPITVYTNTNFQVDRGATLQALPFGTYPNSMTAPAHFISVSSGASNVAITGGGKIDGNGDAWWSAYNAKTITNRPRLIQINRSDVVLLSGLTLINSPMFHVATSSANNVTMDGLTITSPSTAPNTDGIDPSGLHYLIKNCTISVGDDNIAIKPGSTACGDMTVTGCTFGAGHGISVGGQTNVGLDGLLVDRCTFNGTTSGLRLKADATQGGPVQNLIYSNLTMTGVQYPIVFYSYYVDVGTPGAISGANQTTVAKVAAWNAAPPDSLKLSTIPIWKNVTLTNITSTGATGYSTIWGLPLASALMANITLDNVRLSGSVGLEIFNAQNVRLIGNSTITVPAGVAPFVTYNALALASQPRSQTVAPGASASFNVGVAGASGLSNTAPTYRWMFNGAPLADGPAIDGTNFAGTATATLTLDNIQPSAAGSYTVKVSNALDTYDATITTLTSGNTPVVATSTAAVLTVAPPQSCNLTNLSVRSLAGAGDQTLIVGFSVAGYGKPLLLRGVGPTLGLFNVGSTLADPQLTLFAGPTAIATNDNWGSATASPALAAAARAVGAFTLTDGSTDAALLATADNSSYTTQITGPGGASGVALAEIYDTAPGLGARLTNLSARSVAGSGDATLIVGFFIAGTGQKKLLIRGVGPTLTAFGVVGALADPQLALYSEQTLIGGNDKWGSTAAAPAIVSAAAQVGAFMLPDGSKDAVLLVTLPPGAYTTQVSGVGGATGIALVEIYEVP